MPACRPREDGIYESGLLRGDLFFSVPSPPFFSLLYIKLSTPVLLLSFSYVMLRDDLTDGNGGRIIGFG